MGRKKISGEVERRDNMARALAAICACYDLLDGVMPAALGEAIGMGREALANRDDAYQNCVLVVGESHSEAADWADRNTMEGGATCVPLLSGREFAQYVPPFSVVVLPGADRTDDWPRLYAQIVALGPLVDVIRIGRRPTTDLTSLGPGRA